MQGIRTPAGGGKSARGVSVRLCWNDAFGAERTARFRQAQQRVDSEVLRSNEPYMPRQSGALIRSGNAGTHIGSGVVRYTASYAAEQFYRTPSTRFYDAQRGGHWFLRMKVVHGPRILRAAAEIAGAAVGGAAGAAAGGR